MQRRKVGDYERNEARKGVVKSLFRWKFAIVMLCGIGVILLFTSYAQKLKGFFSQATK